MTGFQHSHCNITFGAIKGFTALEGRNRGRREWLAVRTQSDSSSPLPHSRGTFTCFFPLLYHSSTELCQLPRPNRLNKRYRPNPAFLFSSLLFRRQQRISANLHLIPPGTHFILSFVLFFFFFLLLRFNTYDGIIWEFICFFFFSFISDHSVGFHLLGIPSSDEEERSGLFGNNITHTTVVFLAGRWEHY